MTRPPSPRHKPPLRLLTSERSEPEPPLIELDGVGKDYVSGPEVVRALIDVQLEIPRGQFVAIVGASGSGKSTLMNILGCLDRPSYGAYRLGGIDVGSRSVDERALVRNSLLGFIFQGFNLLPRTTALENVELPLVYRGMSRRERRRLALEALEQVGLLGRVSHRPNELSGGQQQRVAIARALVTRPPLLLADEPTGNLDSKTTLEVMDLLERLVDTERITLVLVTHEDDIAARAHRVITVRDGRIEDDTWNAPPPPPRRSSGTELAETDA
ncbi:MAG TPA: ABC transporter ATP-binding protein [Polyangiaceae bacterium]|nr:ABC transporter ATP-binding protein [Polyangiaceae bacterium]